MTFRKKSRYWKLKDKSLDPKLSRTDSIRGNGHFIRQITE